MYWQGFRYGTPRPVAPARVFFGIDCNGNARSLDEIADRAYEILLASVGRCLAAPVQQQAWSEITSD
jgi:hypothetical protein